MSIADRVRFTLVLGLGLALFRCQYDVVFNLRSSDGSAAGAAGSPGLGDASGWVETSEPPSGFVARERAAYVSTGSQLFVWGGLDESGTALDSGALYDPERDFWTIISIDAATPTARSNATAVWTGSRVIVWGGFNPATGRALGDGAVYDPVEDAWTEIRAAEVGRSAPVGAYLDGRVVFWGGEGQSGEPLGGVVLYYPSDDTWQTPASNDDDPGAVDAAAVATGEDALWVFGGTTAVGISSSSGTYSASDSFRWDGLPSSPLTPRSGGFAAFVDLEFHIWGGRDQDENFRDGILFDTGANLGWWSRQEEYAPSARYRSHRESGWAFGVGKLIFVIGGLDAPDSYLRDGGIYDAAGEGNGWTDIEAWPGAASHAYGAVDWASDTLVVWGGRDGSSLTNSGARYRPSTPR